ncbi:hypothetical protein LDENG_00018210 [Lucifuga dentata]|nr:hypothetical protein LDENG_00018210 [Lucifuga dentata]
MMQLPPCITTSWFLFDIVSLTENIMKMDKLLFVIAAFLITLCDSRTLECIQKTKSCDDIKFANGYKYPFDVSGTATEVYHNQTLIACGSTKPFEIGPEVISMDQQAVVTKSCLNLKVKCIIPDGNKFITEYCMEYKVTENREKPTPWGLIIGIPVAVISIFGMIRILYCCCIHQKKQQEEQQSSDTFSGTFSCLRSGCCLKEGISKSRHHEETEVQGDSRNDLKSQHSVPESSSSNRDVNRPSEQPPDTDTHGRDEYDIEQELTVSRIDPETDGRTAEALRLSARGIQLSNENREQLQECTPGDQTDEGQALLSNMRNAFQGFDLTDETAGLVNKRGFDSDQADRCSSAPVQTKDPLMWSQHPPPKELPPPPKELLYK